MSGVSKETSHIFTWIFEDRLSCMKKITGQAVFLYLLENQQIQTLREDVHSHGMVKVALQPVLGARVRKRTLI